MTNEPTVRKILTVFLASPSDLVEERKVARKVVETINRIVSLSIGWQIDLRGWEDTLPNSGRPQSHINKDVESCDLFIGMLWGRWGTSTGQYSSGFEEEFELAKKMYRNNQSPHIWLVFKEEQYDQLQCSKKEQKKVLDERRRISEFRKNLIDSKEFYFKTFNNINDWEYTLLEWLLKYVLDLSQSTLENEQSESSLQLSLPSENQAPILLSAESSEQTNDDATEQIINLTSRINQSLSSSEAKDSLSWFEIARLSSFARTLLMRRYDDEFFSNHEIHLIYQYRSQLKATVEEKIQILRTIITDTNDQKVGWYWYKEVNVTDLLFYIASINSNSDSQQAIKILESARVCLTSDPTKYNKILKSVLLDQSITIKICWLSYLGLVGKSEDISIANRACSDDNLSVCSAAETARILILIRFTPNDAFFQLLENRVTITDLIITHLRNQSESLSEENLLKGLKHRNPEIRLISLEKLIEKQRLSEFQLRELLNDSSNAIKRICYEAIIRLGGDVSLEEIKTSFGEKWFLQSEILNLLTIFFTRKSLQDLANVISAFSFDSYIAYKVMATEHFGCIAEQVRENLEDEFASFAKEHITQRIMSEFKVYELLNLAELQGNADEIKLVHEQLNKINDIIEREHNSFNKYDKHQFIGAALSGLLLHGNYEDIKWGRKYLVKNSNITESPRTEVIQIVEKYGDSSDVVSLIDIAKENYGELSNLAAKAAIKLSSGINGAALELLRSEKPNLVRIAIKSFETEDRSKVREILEPFLRKENRLLHSYALLYFLKHSSHEELEDLLDRYLQERYYYHVVCLIDRILYAHSPYREMYLNKFEDELNQYFKF